MSTSTTWPTITAVIRSVIEDGTNQSVCMGDRVRFSVDGEEFEQNVRDSALLSGIISVHDALYVDSVLETVDGNVLRVLELVWQQVGDVRKRVVMRGPDRYQYPTDMTQVTVQYDGGEAETFYVGEDAHPHDGCVRTMLVGETAEFEGGPTMQLVELQFAHSPWDFDDDDGDLNTAGREEIERAHHLFRTQRYQAAARRYTNCASLVTDGVSHSNAAQCFINIGMPSQALEAADRALEDGDDRPKTHLRRATALYMHERYSDAQSELKRCGTAGSKLRSKIAADRRATLGQERSVYQHIVRCSE